MGNADLCLVGRFAVSSIILMYLETSMTKSFSLAAYLAATTLAFQLGCQSTNKGPAPGPMVDAASADARIYVNGAD